MFRPADIRYTLQDYRWDSLDVRRQVAASVRAVTTDGGLCLKWLHRGRR